ncbi:hypothetical protein HAV15_007703 [Penicillium sp. str. |nr:hypothetical protein HAV15_007703 [Penicillium sp. str. \
MNSSLAFLGLNSFGPTIAVGLAMDRRVVYSTSGADGPISNKIPGWKPTAYTNAIASGAKRYDIKEADITANPPPNRAVVLNKEDTGVCDVAVNRDQVSLRRHLRKDPGATMRLQYSYHAYVTAEVAPEDYRRTEQRASNSEASNAETSNEEHEDEGEVEEHDAE